MASEMIDGAHVYPEDLGTDAPEDYEQQHSAGFRGGLARHRTFLDYVETGLTHHPDWGARTLDIDEGLVHLLHDPPTDQGITVQDQTGAYSLEWRSGMGIAVDVPDVEGLSLESNAENHVFLNYHPSLGDGASYVINSTDSRPDGTHLKLAVVDTAAEEVRYELPFKGMTGHWAYILLEETVDDPKAAARKGYVDGEIRTTRSELSSEIDTVESQLSQDIQAVEDKIFSGRWNDLSGKPDTYPPSSHTHSLDDVEGAAAESDLFSGSYTDLSNVPNEFTPKSHDHTGDTLRPDQLDGGVTNSGAVSNVVNTWVLAEGESLPSAAQPGDIIVRDGS